MKGVQGPRPAMNPGRAAQPTPGADSDTNSSTRGSMSTKTSPTASGAEWVVLWSDASDESDDDTNTVGGGWEML